MRRLGLALAFLGLSLVWPGAASAIWSEAFPGSGYSTALSMPAGGTPTVEAVGRSALVSWPASGGSVSLDGYEVKRYDPSEQPQAIEGACSEVIAGLTCAEDALPPGEWTYSVTPARANWRGGESAKSVVISIAPPSLSLDLATVSSLPTTVTGQIGSFVGGQGVSFRLDDPNSGQLLAGEISPSAVPANGIAEVSVTLPTEVASGPHTIYAIGDQGDIGSAEVTVAPPVTISTSAWNLRDASSGVESDSSDATAFAGDGQTVESTDFEKGFSPTRNVDYLFNSPLEPGLSASASFNFDFAPTRNADTACFYFEVYSGGNLIGTHGSSEGPVACKEGNAAFQTTSTPLPEVTTTTVANGLEVKVYATNSGKRGLSVDLATVSGTAMPSQSFTLYEMTTTNSGKKGTAAAPWSLGAAGDEGVFTSAAGWTEEFSGSRYLSFGFPAYVPSGASIEEASFIHSYRSQAVKTTTCYFFDVYSGGTLLGTQGSAESPVSCSSSTSTWVTDVVPLPEVTTATEANSLTVKMYATCSKLRSSSHDLAELQLTYAP